MVVSIKDGIKLVGISIVCFCAVFVTALFMNFYFDVKALSDSVTEMTRALYDAQVSMSKFVCAITGGILTVIAALMTLFYIKLYVNGNAKRLGLLKAMGYSDGSIAARFWVFGFSVFVGVSLGYCLAFAAMPAVYADMSIYGLPEAVIRFHPIVLVVTVLVPTVVFGALSCGFAYAALRRPVLQMLSGKPKDKKIKPKKHKSEKQRSFLSAMCISALGAKKSLVFFVAFSCFCFSAMVQMGASMNDLSSVLMGVMMLSIGLVLAAVSMFMAITSLINGNIKNIAVMKTFGYSTKECALAILAGYVPFAFLGFGLGTAYQYGLLSLMVNVFFKDVYGIPDYKFDVAVFFITLAVFIVVYLAVMASYAYKMSRVSVKEIMTEQ